MTTTLVPDTTTDRHAIARGLVEVDHLDHEAALWRELADLLAEPLALHNLLAAGDQAQRRQREQILRGIFNDAPDAPELSAGAAHHSQPVPALNPRNTSPELPELHSIPSEPDPDPVLVLADVAPRRGGKYRRTDRPGWLQRLRDAWADEIGAPT